jgi:hypothetical protein
MPSFNRHSLHGALERRPNQETHGRRVQRLFDASRARVQEQGINERRWAALVAVRLEAQNAQEWAELAIFAGLLSAARGREAVTPREREAVIAKWRAMARQAVSVVGIDALSNADLRDLRDEVQTTIEGATPAQRREPWFTYFEATAAEVGSELNARARRFS